MPSTLLSSFTPRPAPARAILALGLLVLADPASPSNTACPAPDPAVTFIEHPVWRSLMPEEGVFPVSLRAPVDARGERIVPRNLREAHCLLDQMLDARVKAALLAVAPALKRTRGQAANDLVDRYENALEQPLGEAIGEPGWGQGYYRMLLTEIQALFELRQWRVEDPAPLLATFYDRGIDSGNEIVALTLISYLQHLGARGIDLHFFFHEFRKPQPES